MSRILRYALIAAALLFAQQAAQVHALSHVRHDPAKNGAPLSGHPAAQCLALHAIDSALPNVSQSSVLQHVAPRTATYFILPIPLLARFDFESRAPPRLS